MRNFHPSFRLDNRSFESVGRLTAYVEENYPGHLVFLRQWFDDSPFITLQTSGSTGKPKSIVFPKEKLEKSARRTASFFGVPEASSVLMLLSPGFVAGKMMWVRALTLGWHLDIFFESAGSMQKNYDFSAMVPLQAERMAGELHRFSKLILGGAPLSPALEKKLNRLDNEIYLTYGMTETLTHVAVRPLTGKALNRLDGYLSGELPAKFYRTLPGVIVSVEEDNTLIIRDGELDTEVRTNDVAEVVDARHFVWKGRKDWVINSGGIKIHPETVERKLAPYINRAFFVAGLPDKKWGEKLVLIVEGNEVKGLLDKVRNVPDLDYYEKPKAIYFLASFERSSGGKILRNENLRRLMF